MQLYYPCSGLEGWARTLTNWWFRYPLLCSWFTQFSPPGSRSPTMIPQTHLLDILRGLNFNLLNLSSECFKCNGLSLSGVVWFLQPMPQPTSVHIRMLYVFTSQCPWLKIARTTTQSDCPPSDLVRKFCSLPPSPFNSPPHLCHNRAALRSGPRTDPSSGWLTAIEPCSRHQKPKRAPFVLHNVNCRLPHRSENL